MLIVMLYLAPVLTEGTGKGRGHLIKCLFISHPHHRRAQVWHALSKDHIVFPATHVFIHERNEPYLSFAILADYLIIRLATCMKLINLYEQQANYLM